MHHHHRRRPFIEGGERVRRELPLIEHPLLDVETDFALITMEPMVGTTPYVELVGEAPLPELRIESGSGTTRVHAIGIGSGFEERLRRGRFWEGSFWERRRWRKHLQVQLVFHVPRNIRARIRPSAAYVHIERLEGCELDVHTPAGALYLEDVSGRLSLATEAGRIDGTGIAGTIAASTSAGAIRLELVNLDPGRHRVRTSMGAAIIELARDLPVQIDTRTAMGSARVEAPSTRGADAVLDVEAELGAIRVFSSNRPWVPSPPRRPATTDVREAGAGPYRTSEPTPTPTPSDDDEAMQQILNRVADGSLSPTDARELLRSMGWG